MARIAKSAITQAFDRVANALITKSGSVISREEAKQVAAEFRAKGDGDAAYVIETAYAKADALDVTKYAKTTASDVQEVRAALVKALADADGGSSGQPNGLSQAELQALPAQFRPMVLTLVQMSKLEALPSKPGPKSVKTFGQGIDHAVTLMKAADGGNGKLSSKEVQALSARLTAAGRSTEALVVSNMFTIAKALAGKGKTITDASIDDVAGYALAQIKKHDDDAPGFSNSEVDGLPVTWAALLRLGQMVQGGIAKPTLPADNAPSAFDAFKAQSSVERFYTARAISDNDVGGVAKTLSLSAIPEAARGKIDKDVAERVQEFQWDGRQVDVSYEAITVDHNGSDKTVGYGAFLQMSDAGGNDISWSYLYDTQGSLLGRDYAGFKETPARRGFMPAQKATTDLYLTSDDWTPTTTMTDPEFRALFQTTQTDQAAFLINLTRGYLAPQVFLYRRDETDNSVPAGAGSWQVGEITRDGQQYQLCKWNDIDDNSHTMWFTKKGDDFELAFWNYDN